MFTSKQAIVLTTILLNIAFTGRTAQGVTKVAVVDGGPTLPNTQGELWCAFLNNNGFECTLFPESGPTSSLDAFAVVIDMSEEWTDNNHLLAEVINSARGVITWGLAPQVLGIDTEPSVRAWIGANASSFGSQAVTTTDFDSILGEIVPGTTIEHSGKFGALGLDDTSGHEYAKVLARHDSGSGAIALLRNRNIGQSVYFSDIFTVGPSLDEQIILRAVQELSVPVIPATSPWGCVALFLGIGTIGLVLVRRKFSEASSVPPSTNQSGCGSRNELLRIVFLGGLMWGLGPSMISAAEIVVEKWDRHLISLRPLRVSPFITCRCGV